MLGGNEWKEKARKTKNKMARHSEQPETELPYYKSHALGCQRADTGPEFRQQIYLSDGQVDLQNYLSVMKSTCPTQK